MPISYEKFVSWVESKLPPIQTKGNEILVNSIFCEDNKKHLWCNPFGGKNKIEYGVYHCWKTDKKGTLVNLVMMVDKCSFKNALVTLGLEADSFRAPEDINFEFGFEEIEKVENYEDLFLKIDLPPNAVPINKAPLNWYDKAKSYLDSRKLFDDRFYICIGGSYDGRIIIPYYSPEGKLIYFNGRTITNNSLRYRGPAKEIGVGKEDVLFFCSYPKVGEKVYLCEGEFDALSLQACGFNGVACGGKNLSDKQAVQLSSYKVCIAFDADEAGQRSLSKIRNKIIQYGHPNVAVVKPPISLKDWNNFYVQHDSKIVQAYVNSTEKKYESDIPHAV
jgi:hypothetical protein